MTGNGLQDRMRLAPQRAAQLTSARANGAPSRNTAAPCSDVRCTGACRLCEPAFRSHGMTAGAAPERRVRSKVHAGHAIVKRLSPLTLAGTPRVRRNVPCKRTDGAA